MNIFPRQILGWMFLLVVFPVLQNTAMGIGKAWNIESGQYYTHYVSPVQNENQYTFFLATNDTVLIRIMNEDATYTPSKCRAYL